uniref:Putative terminase n=1 Tax=viral metagenome TaxID=1070528 RepID=A0A6M3XQ49_9ZZZZ
MPNIQQFITGEDNSRYMAAKQMEELEVELRALAIQNCDYLSFAKIVNPKFLPYRHNIMLAEHLEAVVAGDINRLMVFEPPRHGKSEQVSRILPAYFLFKHPDKWVGLTSYGASLATGMSRNAKSNYARVAGRVKSKAGQERKDGVEEWQTMVGGGMWAAGVGGAMTGKGFHLGIVDDPIKNAEEAFSNTIREKQKEWWESTFYTRAEPDAAIVLVQTRWHEEDLSGWLLEVMEKESPEHWTIINLPAIKDKHHYMWPVTCNIVPDWRRDGEALCPERYDVVALRRLMHGEGGYFAEALYQQRPSSVTGKGRIHYAFDSDNISEEVASWRKPMVVRGRWVGDPEIWVGMDFNVNPMSAVICRKVADQLHQFDEIEIEDSGTEEMCQEIERRYPGSVINVCPDPSGKARKTSAVVGRTDFTIISGPKAKGGHEFKLYAPAAAPPRADRYNNINVLCGESGYAPRYFVHPRCKRTIKCLLRYSYKPNTSIPEDNAGLDHMPAALGYLVSWLFPVRGDTKLKDLRRRM